MNSHEKANITNGRTFPKAYGWSNYCSRVVEPPSQYPRGYESELKSKSELKPRSELKAPKEDELADSIRRYGVWVPITVCDGKIINGRKRYAISKLLGIECPTIGGPVGKLEILKQKIRKQLEK